MSREAHRLVLPFVAASAAAIAGDDSGAAVEVYPRRHIAPPGINYRLPEAA
jgi:hypothetical protein